MVNQIYQVKPLVHVIEQVESFGISSQQIYEGTELDFRKIKQEFIHIDSEDEFRISRNILKYSNDPLIGLKVGSRIQIESLGILGFATLSAATRKDALDIFSEYNELIGSRFNFLQKSSDDILAIDFYPYSELPDDLLAHYSNIQMAALAFSEGKRSDNLKYLKEVRFMHDQSSLKAAYENFFNCPVSFGHERNSILFDRAYGDKPMPRSDVETSRLCQEECRRAIASMNNRRPLHQKVRDVILQTPGEFPGIIEISQQLNIPERTLRRKLSKEGTSYQELLASIRFQLAKEYLKTELPIEKIANLVGYGEAANFSHAFKRWAGISPRLFRQQYRQNVVDD